MKTIFILLVVLSQSLLSEEKNYRFEDNNGPIELKVKTTKNLSKEVICIRQGRKKIVLVSDIYLDYVSLELFESYHNQLITQWQVSLKAQSKKNARSSRKNHLLKFKDDSFAQLAITYFNNKKSYSVGEQNLKKVEYYFALLEKLTDQTLHISSISATVDKGSSVDALTYSSLIKFCKELLSYSATKSFGNIDVKKINEKILKELENTK